MEGNERVVGESAATFRGGGFVSIASTLWEIGTISPVKRDICVMTIRSLPLQLLCLATYPVAV